MASSRVVDRIRIGFSPLSQTLYLYRHGKDPALALEKRECERDVMGAIVEYMMHDAPKGASLDFHFGEKWYRLTLEPINPSPAQSAEGGEDAR